jgi:hypothetical protein
MTPVQGQRVAIVTAAAFLMAALLVLALPTTQHGADCGSVVASNVEDLKFGNLVGAWRGDTSGQRLVDACKDAHSARTNWAIGLGLAAVAMPIGVLVATRREPSDA